MSILKPFRRVVLACVATLAMAGIVRANNIFSVSGPNISYSGGEIDTQSPDPLLPTAWFFGTPIISGSDDLHFTSDISKTTKPIDFRVTTPGAEDYQDGTLVVNASTTSPLGSIAVMSITEGGDYLIRSATAASSAAAVLNIIGMQITQLNGVTPANISVPFTESFTQPTGSGPATLDGNYALFFGAGPLTTGTWQGTASFNIAGALAASGHAGQRVTGLSLVLDDSLSGVVGDPHALVSITKKDFILSTNPVPEPSSIILGVLGGLGMVTVGLRKKFAKTA